jgi:hypothetical protein
MLWQLFFENLLLAVRGFDVEAQASFTSLNMVRQVNPFQFCKISLFWTEFRTQVLHQVTPTDEVKAQSFYNDIVV